MNINALRHYTLHFGTAKLAKFTNFKHNSKNISTFSTEEFSKESHHSQTISKPHKIICDHFRHGSSPSIRKHVHGTVFQKNLTFATLGKMTRLTTYLTCILAGVLTVTTITAGQTPDVPPQGGGNSRSGYMGYRIEHGDTSYYDSIDPAWIFPRGYRGNRRDLKKYYRLVYNFNKVYPYALLASDMENKLTDTSRKTA